MPDGKWRGQPTDPTRDIVVDHNTIIQPNAFGIVVVGGPPTLGFVFTNNLVRHNEYGLKGDNRASGLDTIRAYFPASNITANVIADGQERFYPSGNLFPSSAEFQRQFVSYETGDYRLVPGSPWRNAGLDGGDLGAGAPGAAVQPPRPPGARIREP